MRSAAASAGDAMKPRVLIVCEEPRFRHWLRAALPAQEFDAYELANAERALQFTQLGAPDMVILAFDSLPRSRAWSDAVRSNAETRHIQTVVVLPVTAPAETRDAAAIGCDASLATPFTSADVLDCARGLLPRVQRASGHLQGHLQGQLQGAHPA